MFIFHLTNLRKIVINFFLIISSSYIYTEVAVSINKAINSYTAKTSKAYKPITDEIVTKRYVNHCGLLKFRGNREQTAYLSWNDWTICKSEELLVGIVEKEKEEK